MAKRDRSPFLPSALSLCLRPLPSLADAPALLMPAAQEEVSIQLSRLWFLSTPLSVGKSPFSSDPHPSCYHTADSFLSCPHLKNLLRHMSVADRNASCLPFSSPRLPWAPEFPICHLPQSSPALCPRCIPKLGWAGSDVDEDLAPGLSTWTLGVSVLGPTPPCPAVWLLCFSAWPRPDP